MTLLLRSPAIAVLLASTLGSTMVAQMRPAQDGVRLRSIGGDRATGAARAVVVEQGALAHTTLLFPEDGAGQVRAAGDARTQAEHVLENIARALSAARTSLEHLVRLHVYVADQTVAPAVDAVLAARFGARTHMPAVTIVESAMPRAGVLLAMDAVAATAVQAGPGRAIRAAVPGLGTGTPRASHVAIQPEGPFVIVSGRAAPGEFDTAIRETLSQLRADLDSVGLALHHVVQIKGFLGDMRHLSRLESLVADAFDGAPVPPLVVTEWRQDTVPAEIELVAAAPAAAPDAARVEHVEPVAGRYSRVARANAGRPIFLSGLYGRSPDPVAQVDEMFAELRDLLREAGSDMRHLVKATYYVADAAADARINTIRPTIFDPAHPPAASKLSVRGVGRQGKGSTFDMIAVTVNP